MKKIELLLRKQLTDVIHQSNQATLELFKIQQMLSKALQKNLSKKWKLDKLKEENKKLENLKKENEELKKVIARPYQTKTEQIIRIQATFRGFLVRRNLPLSARMQQRQAGICKISNKVVSALLETKQFEKAESLMSAINNKRWHEAIQIIRNIPEKEIELKNGAKLKY